MCPMLATPSEPWTSIHLKFSWEERSVHVLSSSLQITINLSIACLRAYVSQNTIVIHNTCEDSLLATPLIIDLVVLAELCERITTCTEPIQVTPSTSGAFVGIVEEKKFCGEQDTEKLLFERFHSVLSLLSYMLKAPLVPPGTPVVNALAAQRQSIINVFRACTGLPPDDFMRLEHKVSCSTCHFIPHIPLWICSHQIPSLMAETQK